ncbi:unnamed protein product [Ectocarpus sp. 4 AP-2014]|uniref:EsV-1-69 n=1 Tax=Ectocarpus siliculosus virus 1 (isolate New Zealand/Kaikoura/1988) TaxID=654926 RepID=Q8QNK4_ESV1K|nr:EsV-1-69 [Ectocarpus siliculosus virus 1]AAK14492.1 EsV-1-69 [Ectocarpus siliculosus virus 1]
MASATKKKQSTGVSRSYTVLRKSTLDPKKKVSSQGTSRTTTKTGAHLAARVAIKRRTRPSRIYLYRKKRIITYSVKYTKNKDGKTKASATQIRSVTAKRKKTSSTKKDTKKKRKTTKRKTTKRKTTKRRAPKPRASTAAEINLISKKLVRLSQRV